MGSKKKVRFKRIRSNSLILALLGGIIVVWALTRFDYFGYNPPLIIGISILCFALVTLLRRKGDYDDFDDDVGDGSGNGSPDRE